jgi:maleate isomerase
MARVAAIAEFWLDITVLAMNSATSWWALRQSRVDDKVYGFGSLLEDF